MPKKLSLNDAIKIAESHGGKCLSIEYVNNITPMLWECNKFHQWTTRFYNIKNKHSWCPHCVSKKLNISVAQELALAKNGTCISENYINNKSPLLGECKNNHQFRLSLAEVKNDKCWCRECKKLSLEFAQNLANKKGGKCISSSYCNRFLGDVLKVIHGLLELIKFKEELGVPTAKINENNYAVKL